mgnify:CR=1 FL=1
MSERRRAIQMEHNRRHGITPTSIRKEVQQLLIRKAEEKRDTETQDLAIRKSEYDVQIPEQRAELTRTLEQEMLKLAEELEFERAAVLRDEIERLNEVKIDRKRPTRKGSFRRRGAGQQ